MLSNVNIHVYHISIICYYIMFMYMYLYYVYRCIVFIQTAAIHVIMKCSYIRNIKVFLNGNISEISEIIFYVKPKIIKALVQIEQK